MSDLRLIPLSALQHYAFCPRQCALIHCEKQWSDNWLTAQGNKLHQRVDSGEPETRKGIRYERALVVSAPQLGLTGKLDLVEKHLATGSLTPVEYKRGRGKIDDCDRVQLCSQVLCLEEMTGQVINQGALWYWQQRKRQEIRIDTSLRQRTLAVVAAVRALFDSGTTPEPILGKHCNACSLQDVCNPELVYDDASGRYLQALFKVVDK